MQGSRRIAAFPSMWLSAVLLIHSSVLSLASARDADNIIMSVADHKQWVAENWENVIGSEFGFEMVQENDLDGLSTFGCKDSVFRPATHCVVHDTVEVALERCAASPLCGGVLVATTNFDDWVDDLEALQRSMLLRCKRGGPLVQDLFPNFDNITVFYNLNCTELLVRRGYDAPEEPEPVVKKNKTEPVVTTKPIAATTPAPQLAEETEDSSGLSTGAIIGIAVGAGVGLLILLLLILLLAMLMYRRKGTTSLPDTVVPTRLDQDPLDVLPETLVAKTIDAELQGASITLPPEAFAVVMDKAEFPIKMLKVEDDNEGALKAPPRRYTNSKGSHTNSMDTAYSSPSGSVKESKDREAALCDPSSPSTSMSRYSDTSSPAEAAAWWPPAGAAMMLENIWDAIPPPVWLLNLSDIEYYQAASGTRWRLGTEGHTEVFRARHVGREVAVKHLQLTVDGLDSVRSLVDGMTNIVDCSHEALVQVYGAAVQGLQLVMACEYMPIGDLLHVLDSPAGRSMTWNERGKFICLDIIRGLQFLHSRGLSHGCLTSHKILISSSGNAKVSDFGLAHLRATGVVTPAPLSNDFCAEYWQAPEVLAGAAANDKADMFSFGVILWEIVTGERPQGSQLRQPRVGEECSQEVADLIAICTQDSVVDRPDAAVVEAIIISIVSH